MKEGIMLGPMNDRKAHGARSVCFTYGAAAVHFFQRCATHKHNLDGIQTSCCSCLRRRTFKEECRVFFVCKPKQTSLFIVSSYFYMRMIMVDSLDKYGIILILLLQRTIIFFNAIGSPKNLYIDSRGLFFLNPQ